MKKKYWIILALTMLIVLLCCGTALAAVSGTVNGLEWTLTDAGTITFSGTGTLPDYGSAYNLSPFDGNTSIQQVVTEAGVSLIGNNVFYECTSLTDVTILNSEAYISGTAFRQCSESLKIHGWEGSSAQTYAQQEGYEFVSLGTTSGSCGTNVTYIYNPMTCVLTINGTGTVTEYTAKDIPWSAYKKYITSVEIGSGVTSIGYAYFYECFNVSSVTIPASVTSIGSYAFAHCYKLDSVTIPAGLTTIEQYAFMHCYSLTSVTIPASVTMIKFGAFYNCSELTEATVLNPNAVIGEGKHDVFNYCAYSFKLRGLANSTAETYATVAGIYFERIIVDDPTLFLPATLTTIHDEAFSGIAAKGIVIPGTVTVIASNAFSGSQVTTIYGYAGSAAETFCSSHTEFTFIPIDDDWIASH